MSKVNSIRRVVVSLVCGAACFAGVLHAANAGLLSDDEARKQIQVLQQQTQDLSDRLGKAEDTLKSDALVDLFEKIEDLKSQVNNLRGQIEVLSNSIDQTAKHQRDMYVDLDTRIRALEQANASAVAAAATMSAAPAVTPAATNAQNAGSTNAAKPTVKEDAAYEAAQVLRRKPDYPNAVKAFQNFIKQYPNSSLAPRAQYWIGDSYYNQRDYKNAIAAQQTLIANYPDSPSVPDAMLNIATAQQDAGDAASAKKTLQDLVAKFPISDAGQKARRRLDAANVATPAASATPVTSVTPAQ